MFSHKNQHPCFRDRKGFLLNCLITFTIDINQENMCDVISTANVLQFNTLMPVCEKFLSGNITDATCLQLLKLCETCSLEDCRKKVEEYFMRHFTEVSKAEEFLDMDKDAFFRYLSDPEMSLHGSEFDIYKAVIRWIKHDQASRARFSVELLSQIRMHHISFANLTDELLQEVLVQSNPKVKSQFREALKYHAAEFGQPIMPVLPPREMGVFAFHYREDYDVQCVYSLSGVKNEMARYHDTSSKFTYLSANIVPVKNFIFVFGEYSDKKPFAQRYDAVLNKWAILSPKPRRHDRTIDATAVHVGDKIMIAGGWQVDNPDTYNVPCLLYSIPENKWEMINSSPARNRCLIGSAHNGLVYLTKGNHKDRNMWAYDTTAKIWLRKAHSPEGIGGIFENFGDKLLLVIIDQGMFTYDILTNQWSTYDQAFPSLAPTLGREICQMDGCFSFVNNNKMYIVGFWENNDWEPGMLIIDFNKMEVSRVYLENMPHFNMNGLCVVRFQTWE